MGTLRDVKGMNEYENTFRVFDKAGDLIAFWSIRHITKCAVGHKNELLVYTAGNDAPDRVELPGELDASDVMKMIADAIDKVLAR